MDAWGDWNDGMAPFGQIENSLGDIVARERIKIKCLNQDL
jgi:hypothetical protein